jgi:hypothetical protein
VDAHWLTQLLLLGVVLALAINGLVFAQMRMRGGKMWLRWTIFVPVTAVLFTMMDEGLWGDWISGTIVGLIGGLVLAAAVDRRELLDLIRR